MDVDDLTTEQADNAATIIFGGITVSSCNDLVACMITVSVHSLLALRHEYNFFFLLTRKGMHYDR